MTELETLIRFIQKKKPVLWVGAGLSIDAGFPTAGVLADRLWEDHAFDARPPNMEAYELIDDFYRRYGRGALDEALSTIIPTGSKAGPSHHGLARIVKANGFARVITTNYDRLLESAFSEREVDFLLQIIDANQHIREGQRPRLFKIHRDVADLKKVILTGESYRAFKDRYRFLYNQFDILLTQNPVLFLGCSMLDDRILDWLEALTPENAELIHPWMALLTASQRAAIKKHKRPSGLGAWEILNKILFRVLELPDFDALPRWLETAAQEIAGADAKRNELILHISPSDGSATERWLASLDGRAIAEPALPIQDDGFIEKLEELENMIHVPLPCDARGAMGDKEKVVEAAIYELATRVGAGLATALDERGRQTILAAVNRDSIPLLRVVVEGEGADRVLALPWELLLLDGRFPVKEARLDIVREIRVPGAQGLETRSGAFKVLVHIAAPEDDEGQGALNYEEEAYRLVLSMQRAAEDAVAFSDLGSVRDLVRAVRRVDPTVVHFTGHGSPGTLLFEDEFGEKSEIPISELLDEMRASAVEGQSALPRVFYLASCYGASGGTASAAAPSTATTLQREGCPAIVAYIGPVGDQLSTWAEVAFYSGLVAGKRLTESVRGARHVMTKVLGEKDRHYRFPLGWVQLALFLRGDDAPITMGDDAVDDIYALEQELNRPDAPVHSLDALRSGMDGFIGRRKDLATLRRRHFEGRRIFVLHGLGGVGKTALAINLIPKLDARPDRILMLDAARADSAADPVQDLWEQMTEPLGKAFPDILANVLETNKEEQEPLILLRDMISAVKRPWLIYLDNAESLQVKVESKKGDLGAWASPGMAQWWCVASSGAVLGGPLTLMATTRYLWEDLDPRDSRPVGALRPADIARMMRWFPYLRRLPHTSKKRIVQWLNGHARALIYLEGLLGEILALRIPEDDVTESEWQAAIEGALPGTEAKLVNEDLMLSHIWKRLDGPVRNQLRALTAMRRPAPLAAVKTLGDQTARLESLGLLTMFPGEFRGMHATVHRFVEARAGKAMQKDNSRIGRWYKDVYETEKRLMAAEEAVYHLAAAGEADSAAPLAVGLAKHYRNNLRYAEAKYVLESVITLSPGADMLESLLGERGNLYNALGRYERATADFQTMVKSTRKRKPSSIHESQGLHGLAIALDRLGRYEEAVETYKKVLEIEKQAYGKGARASYGASLAGLADTLERLGRYDEAIEFNKKALEIQKQAYGTEIHASYGASLAGLANALFSLGRYEEAFEFYKKSLNVKIQVYGTEVHPEYAASLVGFANTLNRLGRYEDAFEAYKKSLDIKKQAYGLEAHPEYAASLTGIANAFVNLGRYEDAVEAYKKSLEIYKQVYGTEEHPEYATSLHGLANALSGLSRYEESVESYKKAIEIEKQVYSTEAHPSFGASLASLANALNFLGRYDEAIESYKKSLDIQKQTYCTEEHSEYGISLAGLANALNSSGRYKEAIEAYKKSLEIKKQAYGTEAHSEYASSLHGLANALSGLEHYEEAIESYKKSLEIIKQVYGSDEHPDSLPTRSSLGMIFALIGRVDQASREMDRALFIARRMGQPYHTGNILFLYAYVESVHDAEKAMEMAREAEALLTRVFEPSHPKLQAVRVLIAKLKGEPDPDREKQRPEVTAGLLMGWTQGLLSGIPSVSRMVFTHLAQRIVLLLNTQGLLTQLAVWMGKPGLELEDPTALKMPDYMPAELVQEYKSKLSNLKALVKRVAKDIEELMQDYPEENGRIVVQGDESHPVPDGFSTVLVGEANAIISAGSDELLRVELDLVLKGLAILLEGTDEPGAIELPSLLLQRLPDQREKIVETLTPPCSEEQRKLLLG